jgi:hypothetical protein
VTSRVVVNFCEDSVGPSEIKMAPTAFLATIVRASRSVSAIFDFAQRDYQELLAHPGSTTAVSISSSTRNHRTSTPGIRGACCLLPWLALCPSLALSAAPHGAANLWLFEQPEPAAPLYRARIAGTATYQDYTANATLAFACRTDGGRVSMELVIDPKALGFDTDPYEGPDATAHGPIVVTGGSTPSVKLKVSGWHGDGGAFNVGTPFVFGMSTGSMDAVARQGLAGGGPLTLEIPAAKGGEKLRATFRWPDDSGVLKRVVTPCLSVPAARGA